jgi:hypothetical protein
MKRLLTGILSAGIIGTAQADSNFIWEKLQTYEPQYCKIENKEKNCAEVYLFELQDGRVFYVKYESIKTEKEKRLEISQGLIYNNLYYIEGLRLINRSKLEDKLKLDGVEPKSQEIYTKSIDLYMNQNKIGGIEI